MVFSDDVPSDVDLVSFSSGPDFRVFQHNRPKPDPQPSPREQLFISPRQSSVTVVREFGLGSSGSFDPPASLGLERAFDHAH